MTELAITYESFQDVDTKEDLGVLAEAIIVCINKAFGQEMPEEEVEESFNGTLVVVAKQAEQVVGFTTIVRKPVWTFKYAGLDGIHPNAMRFSLGAGTVDSEFQGQGIYRELNRRRLGLAIHEKTPAITTTTQNPRVEHGVMVVLNEFIAQGKLASFTVSRERIPGFYGRRLTSYPIETKNTPFEKLDIEAGDCFSLIFRLVYPDAA